MQVVPPVFDCRLVDQIKAGHETGIMVWFKIFRPYVRQFVDSRVDNSADAEELVQKIFLDSLQQISLLRRRDRLYPWMLSIARCRVADFYRKRYAKKAIRCLPLGEQLLALDNRDINQVTQEVQAALAMMRQTSRELILLKYLDDCSVLKIARRQAVTPKAIEAKLYRARQEFRRCYAQVTAVNNCR